MLSFSKQPVGVDQEFVYPSILNQIIPISEAEIRELKNLIKNC